MTRLDFLKLMKFPLEWDSMGMYPDGLFEWQLSHYEPGFENGSEHDRNEAFHWWLRRSPSKRELRALLQLASQDPDGFLGNDVRQYILKSLDFNNELTGRSPNGHC